MIRKILLALVVVVVLVVGVAAAAIMMTPTDFRVERETTINKPRSEVYAYAKMLKNQNDWGPWHKKEPTMHQEFRGTDGQPGFTAYWKGTREDVGEGEQEIIKLSPDERIDTQIRFKQPFETAVDGYMVLEPSSPDNTKVRWGVTGSMRRPLNLFMLVMDLDKEMGKDFEEGLASLKTIVESR